ncbi:hemerythrin HHE cation binding domain protein [mine drainage metagenome]|uniref:Hemerythrin HHE cation binding domain protein n=1 Tax=mine drainage metagenome TaxID=410659 RepID=A0A1J5Q6E8_9ZZZZ
MPDQLFTTSPGFNQPLDLLSACHRRIVGFTEVLQKLPGHLAQYGADADARQAAERVLKYFDIAGQQHHDDEELNLFPILRAAALQEGNSEILSLLEDLLAQHVEMTRAWQELRPHLLALTRGGPAASVPVQRFVALYRKHIPLEENFVLPYAERTLSASQIETLGREMARRRNVAC